jgi:plasmid stabilization system protein ParE
MQKKRLEYLASARRDLRRIAEYYIETAGVIVTAKIGSEIGNAIMQIAEQPEIGRKLETAPYRQLVVSQYPFVILYRLTPASARIIRVLHQAQKRTR